MARFLGQTAFHLNRPGNQTNEEEVTKEIRVGKGNKLRRAFQRDEEACAKALGQEEAWNFKAVERKLAWLNVICLALSIGIAALQTNACVLWATEN